jgi:hypothetical protein
VGSTPTGVFLKQGLTSLGQRRAAHSINGWCRVFLTWTLAKAIVMPPPVSSVERAPDVNLGVAGSNPVPTPQAKNLLEARERESEPKGGGSIVQSAAHCCIRFGELAVLRQHEPKLCSAWIPRSRTQRLRIVNVCCSAQAWLASTGMLQLSDDAAIAIA